MNEFRTEYDRFFAWAMQILHSSGELSAVQEYISTIEDRDYRDATFCKVAVALAAQNRSDEGMLFIQAIEQPMERADALLGVAREHAKRGERLEAKASLMEATTAAESVEHSTWEAPSILLQVSAELHGPCHCFGGILRSEACDRPGAKRWRLRVGKGSGRLRSLAGEVGAR